LQALRYLRRKRSEQDRRAQQLYLTPLGIRVLLDANKRVAQHEEKLIGRIGEQRYPLILDALASFRIG
jgi:DNA-binding MarR family transcriptional regulator